MIAEPPTRERPAGHVRHAWSLREAYDEELQDGTSLRNLILQSWLRSYLRDWPGHASLCEPAAQAAYWQSHQQGVKIALARSRVLLAHDPEDADTAYGYIVVEDTPEGGIVHYVYVKEPSRIVSFRRCGLARALFESAGKPRHASHLTAVQHPWIIGVARRAGVVYDARMLWRRKP